MIKLIFKYIFLPFLILGMAVSKTSSDLCYELFKEGEEIKIEEQAQRQDKEKILKIYQNKANLNLSSKNYEEAIEYYNKIIKLAPKSELAYLHYLYRGIAKSELKNQRGALVDISKSINLNPQCVLSYYMKGVVKGILKWYDGAIEAYNKALQLDHQFFEAHHNLAIIYSKLGYYRKALKHFNEAIKNNSEDSRVYYNKAVTLVNMKRKKDVLTNIKRAIKLNSNFREAFLLKNWYESR